MQFASFPADDEGLIQISQVLNLSYLAENPLKRRIVEYIMGKYNSMGSKFDFKEMAKSLSLFSSNADDDEKIQCTLCCFSITI